MNRAFPRLTALNALSALTAPTLLVGTLALIVGATGCVKSSTYNGVKAKLATCEEDKSALSSKLDKEKKGRAADVAKLTTRAEAAESAKSQLETDLTAVVKDKARLEGTAAELKSALADARARKQQAEKRVAEYRELLAKFKELIDAGKLKVKIVDGRMVLALPTDVLFGSGSAKLSDAGKQAVGEIAQVLATIPGRRFQIEGHTDNVPIKTRKYPSNWELAAARALNVSEGMREAGMPGSALSAASFGEFRPSGKNDTPAGREANRRIEIVLVPDLSSLPGFEELKSAVGDS